MINILYNIAVISYLPSSFILMSYYTYLMEGTGKVAAHFSERMCFAFQEDKTTAFQIDKRSSNFAEDITAISKKTYKYRNLLAWRTTSSVMSKVQHWLTIKYYQREVTFLFYQICVDIRQGTME